ncbi:Zinc transporter ZupT [Gimesia panareensis]|uniref:Zinc transporter ZupT n=1 Tax=Gimesia panareensis TaxID=2527978 RepID=A0A518FW27_9PLAN|nr:ZIP family metal transporter [Gimesia panareensis]QDV20557.1 Zinc transporter ZupT [Gimesia panareensis]
MNVLTWIVISGITMSLIALVGGLTLVLKQCTLEKLLLPLVAFAAGSLIGGALFHMIPASVEQMGNTSRTYVWIVVGFLLFLALEQFLHWHHSHQLQQDSKKPLTYLILIADGLHNFIGGLFVAASFLIDVQLGITAWLVAAAHEVPQELGDFAVLVHGGWSKAGALTYNYLSSLTFLAGGLFVYGVSGTINVHFLVPFAAGNFLYIGAADLIPEIKNESDLHQNIIHFIAFAAGLAVLLSIRLYFPETG